MSNRPKMKSANRLMAPHRYWEIYDKRTAVEHALEIILQGFEKSAVVTFDFTKKLYIWRRKKHFLALSNNNDTSNILLI